MKPNRLEVLLARAAAEKSKAAEKSVKPVKIAKPKTTRAKAMTAKIEKPEPQQIEYNPPISLADAVRALTKEEASDPKNVAMTISLHLFDQLMRSSRPSFDTLSDGALADLAYITAQTYEQKPDLKQVFSRAIRIADCIEFRTGAEEGSVMRALHEMERLLVAQKLKGGEGEMTDTQKLNTLQILMNSLKSKWEAFKNSDHHTSKDALNGYLDNLLNIRDLATSLGNIEVANAMTAEFLRITAPQGAR